ncbi:MAG: helix-turn-helix transcriptional regulator [Epsilonproteobacteria bacterium]|nr:helix-turn-helix transcriptional regulator [Campylobacterota bacterium]
MTRQEILLYTDDEIAEEIAELIKQRRIRLGITQAEMAKRTGISQPSYVNYEKTGQISLVRFFKILRQLGMLGDVGFEILNAESLDRLGAEEYLKAKKTKERSRASKK